MPNPWRKYTMLPPLYGCNLNDDILSLNRYEAYYIKNMHLSADGVPYSRLGSRVLNVIALDGAVTGIYDYRRPEGTGTTSTLIVKAGTILYTVDVDTGDATELVDTNVETRPSFATFQDDSDISYVFIADGTNFYKFDGTDITSVSDSYPWANGAPRYLCVYGDRMLASGCDTDPYKVFVSEALNGTNWLPGDGDTAVYWTLKNAAGDRVTGLSKVYDYGIIFQQFGVTLITEADPDSTTSQQMQVSTEYGTASHWSVQAIGNTLYFADESHIYKGILRAAVENGLEVQIIDKNISGKFKEHEGANTIVSAYDPEHNEIQWGIKTPANSDKGITLVYNLLRSGTKGELGQYDVWSGWFEGSAYEPYTLASFMHTTTKYRLDGTTYTADEMKIYRGDSSGYVYVMEEPTQYKDESVTAGAAVDNDIEFTYISGPVYPGGYGHMKRMRCFTCMIYQKHDDSTTIQWVIDGSISSTELNYGTVIPYWSDDVTTDEKQTWGTTIWNNRPTIPKSIMMNFPFNYVQFKINNVGTNATDYIAFIGAEISYQVSGVRRRA